MSPSLRRLLVVFFLVVLASGMLLVGFSGLVHLNYIRNIYTSGSGLRQDDEPRVALIFGLGRPPDAVTRLALSDRISATIDLLQTSHARKILITGLPDETNVLRQIAEQFNVSADRIVVDDGSASVYESCYRAREMYGVKRAILVAQGFQLDRLLYVCNKLGVDSVGLLADHQAYDSLAQTGWLLGDMFNLVGAWLEVNVLKPVPALGAITPIGD